MDYAGLKRSFALWWRHNWNLVVATLALPVTFIVLVVAMFWWGTPGETGPGPCPPWPTVTHFLYPAEERQIAALTTDMSVGLSTCAPPGTFVPRSYLTVTPVPTTPPPGRLLIHKRDNKGNPLDETCFSVTGQNGVQRKVCDADDRVNDGGTPPLELPPGAYTVKDVYTKPGYFRSPDAQTAIVRSGAATELTFVSRPVPELEGVPVYVYALKCGQDPGFVDGDDVAAGILPTGCALARDVEFIVMDIDEQTNGMSGEFVTDGTGRFSFRALDDHLIWIVDSGTAVPFMPVLEDGEMFIPARDNLRVVMVYVAGCIVSPSEAKAGATFSVTCHGFQSNEMVTFFWYDQAGNMFDANVQATATGYATALFVVPQAGALGPILVNVSGDVSRKMAGAVVDVQPS